MSEDLSEFHGVFFEEVDELIISMESELLEMLSDPDDPEKINTVFRAAHSIKGGSATFGFSAVAEFTHVMETLMDEIREGRKLTPELVNLLLKATDCVRSMMEGEKEKTPVDTSVVEKVKLELQAELGGAESSDEPSIEPESESEPELKSTELNQQWMVHVRPGEDSLKTANDPLTFIIELAHLGDLNVSLDTTKLPNFADFDPQCLYLAWDIELSGQVNEEEIRDVFEWIDVCSDIQIEEASTESSETLEAKESENTITTASKNQDRAQKPAQAAKSKTKPASVPTIRVGIDKIDKLINLVGELVITQSMLTEEGDKLPQDLAEKLQEGLAQLKRYTRELQENVMQIRMVQIGSAFNRLPRMIHDLTGQLDKKVELIMSGEQTELDKTVMESIGDPLVHLVRNAVDHGIETPEVRKHAGKDETGKLLLNAYHESGKIVIEIKDDGAGLNCEKILAKAIDNGLVESDETLSDVAIYELLFHPGFSMAEKISDVSGRGVGMDVVRRNIQSLGGTVEVQSTFGQGSTFTIRLPLTLAIVDGQLVRVGGETFVIPLISIVESIQLKPEFINAVAERGELYRLRSEYIPLVRLAGLFSMSSASNNELLIVVVESDVGKIGLLVDDLLAQQQVVIKSLETNYKRIEGIAGATILGDGTVALIMDINSVISLSRNSQSEQQAA